ncbi:hypothetical protein RFI_04555 [Reticulomyxa filosa]|uniref:ASCH domain-containing protein n=1 Tax=Reticulomyxa filosa TaxID=46433 RepID=X6P2U5_RETFI|nr:hypothetical protein RFI_04555 [Reticulomyxa filosa]|eukprot:ETO32561.1 hypothetical protein RFI_04555 [Reticulomyxa filosa]
MLVVLNGPAHLSKHPELKRLQTLLNATVLGEPSLLSKDKNYLTSIVSTNQQKILSLVEDMRSPFFNFLYFILKINNVNLLMKKYEQKKNQYKEFIKQHQEYPHSLGQYIKVKNEDVSKCIFEQVYNLEKQRELWPYLYKQWNKLISDAAISIEFDFKSRLNYLKPLDFLDRFVSIIWSRQKCATTRWMKYEPFSDNGTISPNQWVLATCSDYSKLFGILYIHSVRLHKFDDITDELAKIENMKNKQELKTILKQIYPDITNEDFVVVVYFTCVHFFSLENTLIFLKRNSKNSFCVKIVKFIVSGIHIFIYLINLSKNFSKLMIRNILV